MGEYSIADHRHRLAAWAASRAASVNGCRFKVKEGVEILQEVGLNEPLDAPDELPDSDRFDEVHAGWRRKIIRAAHRDGKFFSHGVASKLINCYLKMKFVCGGYHEHERVKALHPPIDDVLLQELERLTDDEFRGLRAEWKRLRKIRWSKFSSTDYQEAIAAVRQGLGPEQPLWQIEKFWKGYQS